MKKMLFLLTVVVAGSISAMKFAPFRAMEPGESIEAYNAAKAEYDAMVQSHLTGWNGMIKK